MTWDGTIFNIDANGDGYLDQTAIDSGGDGYVDIWQIDQDGDGLVDQMAFDMDGDGVDDQWTFEPEQVALGDWSAGWVVPSAPVEAVVGGPASAPGVIYEPFAPAPSDANVAVVGGPPVDLGYAPAVDPYADIVGLIGSSPSYSPEIDYLLAMGIVTHGSIGDAMAALHNAQAAASPGFVPSDNFMDDGDFRDYNGMLDD